MTHLLRYFFPEKEKESFDDVAAKGDIDAVIDFLQKGYWYQYHWKIWCYRIFSCSIQSVNASKGNRKSTDQAWC